MTQEENDLLLKDLCARLPYGVKCADFRYDEDGNRIDTINILEAIFPNRQTYKYEGILPTHHISRIKPYLRPMSSMTEEEKHKLLKFGAVTCLENGEVVDVSCVGFERHADIQDYLNACHFDYRGLIPMGLALEATKDMYN